jgi:hypothetical protein
MIKCSIAIPDGVTTISDFARLAVDFIAHQEGLFLTNPSPTERHEK